METVKGFFNKKISNLKMKKLVLVFAVAIIGVTAMSFKTVIKGTNIVVDLNDIQYDASGDVLPMPRYADLASDEIIGEVDPCPGKGKKCTYITGTDQNPVIVSTQKK
jgi:hypothetical protein